MRKKKDDEQVSRLIVKNYRLNQLYEQYKNERNTLIDDIAILKANNERLMRRNEKLEDYLHIRGESSTTYKYEHDVINELEELEDEYKINYKNEIDEIRKVYRKAQAFDNYIVDLAKTMEEYPHNYIKSDDFVKETFEFYMKSKEDFIKAYENEVSRKNELIRDAAEYDRLLSDLEDE